MMKMKLKTGTLLRGAALAFVCAAGPVSADEGAWTSLAREGGQALYDAKCGMCHEPGGMGAGILGRRMDPERSLLVNRDDLELEYIRNVVRGGFGIMFPVPRAEVSDEQLDAIARFLTDGSSSAGQDDS